MLRYTTVGSDLGQSMSRTARGSVRVDVGKSAEPSPAPCTASHSAVEPDPHPRRRCARTAAVCDCLDSFRGPVTVHGRTV